MSARTKLATWLTAVMVLSTASCGTSNDGGRSTGAAADGSTPIGEPGERSCRYVAARPTYLPWLEQGEQVPEPQRTVEKGTSYVSWSDDAKGPSHQKSVTLRRNSEPLGGTGEPVSVKLEGVDGYYYDGPGPQAAVLWKSDKESCSLVTLTLSLPGADRDEFRQEILKIVKSLED